MSAYREEYNQENDDIRRQNLRDWVERVLAVEEQPPAILPEETKQPKKDQNNNE